MNVVQHFETLYPFQNVLANDRKILGQKEPLEVT